MAKRAPRPRSVILGNHRQTGATVGWSPNAQRHHAALFGVSGVGKTTLLTSMLRQHITNGTGLCLIDPHGGLFDELVGWLAFKGYDRKRTVHIIDPSEEGWRVGFNPLAAEEGDLRQVADNVEYILEAFAQAWGGEDINQMPLYQRLLSAVLFAASHKGLTLLEAMKLLPVSRGEYREYVATDLPDHLQQDVWDDIQRFNSRDFQDRFGSAFSRVSRFMRSYYIREMLGQQESIIDFYRCMEDGDIVLVNLSSQKGFSPATAQLLGKLLINSMYAASLQREPENSRAFHLVIDEAESYLSGDVPSILTQCRKFGLHLTLSVQDLGQLMAAGERVYRGVMSGCQTKFVFASGAEDAEELTKYVMPRGGYNLEEPIPSMIRSVPTGIEKRIVRGVAESWANSEVSIDVESHSAAAMSGRTVALPGDVLTTMYSEEGHAISSSATSSQPTEITMDGITSTHALSHSQGSVETSGGSRTESETYVPKFETLPTALYSIEQQRHRHASALADQRTGEVIVKIMRDDPIAVATKLPAPFLRKPERIAAFKERVVQASSYTNSIDRVVSEIEDRQNLLERCVEDFNRPTTLTYDEDQF